MTRQRASAAQQVSTTLIKIVYFDERSASDYLDIISGGKKEMTKEDQKNSATELQASVGAKIAARLSWIPFFDAKGDASAEADISRNSTSLMRQTLSNTVLTDYLPLADEDTIIEKIRGFSVSIAANTFTYAKVFTPYMQIANTADSGVDLSKLDEALLNAKGYYELTAENHEEAHTKLILRFNIRAFRNSYGLADLTKMRLVFHAIKVGKAREDELDVQHELSTGTPRTLDPIDLMHQEQSTIQQDDLLDVYDVLLAGVEYDS
ncbi:DUF6414 family protein [Bifidobacterium crudilactis]|uniref:DUF6414 family protein n=1 Tax=Bifidobacterium crudilactis TaxID=327277 RepID=UPI002646FF5B|nr:DUF6414 family protein [Bifidobacterium crudilactis]MDN5973069.1 DUF6414 family protein [Bifidobacterium crudilactis]MDN6000290.1 DUF6414 family protein [Bifidobacterium crudilactis]MDN6208999.1 DUF6414 family protein [Bifidobacterium crudilactis]MDN6467901.1 DUF6414 family protein [Bifidobacterium crudilactis]MDN6558659.1 DUF6414 family protein [Bifidobacterium crudilactis]